MTVGTEDAAAAGSTAPNALKPRQTGAKRLTGCEKAKNSTGMPAGAGMSQPPETGTDAVTGVTDLETDMRDPAETEALKGGMAKTVADIAGTGQDLRTGTTGAGLTTTQRMQTGTALATDPSARKQRG